MNDLQEFLEQKNVNGLQSVSADLDNELSVYMKIFLLLYADDTILLSASSDDLQMILNNFHEFCAE